MISPPVSVTHLRRFDVVGQLLTPYLFTLMLLMPQGSEGMRKDVASGGGTRGVGCRVHDERAFSSSTVAWGAKEPALSCALTPLGSPLRHDAASEHIWLRTLVSVGAWLRRVHVAFARAYAPFFALLISLVMSCVNLCPSGVVAGGRSDCSAFRHGLHTGNNCACALINCYLLLLTS
jgi:hypothetical protein